MISGANGLAPSMPLASRSSARADLEGGNPLPPVRTKHTLLPILRSIVLSLVLLVSRAVLAADNAHFYFVQITDTHFGTKDHNSLTERIVERINDLPMPIACVVHTGDIGSDNLAKGETASAATSILARVKAPVLYVAGNHDLPKKTLKESLEAYRRHFGALAGKAEFNGVVFLTVCTEPISQAMTIRDYDPMEWLASALREAGDKPVVLFQHEPPTGDFYKNEMHEGWPAKVRQQWEGLLKAHNVKGVICGHFHRDEMHWVGGIPLYVAPPVARYYERQPSFRVYEYDKGRLGYFTVYME